MEDYYFSSIKVHPFFMDEMKKNIKKIKIWKVFICL